MSENPSPARTARVAWWALACAVVALVVGLAALLVAVGTDDAGAPADSISEPTRAPPESTPPATTPSSSATPTTTDTDEPITSAHSPSASDTTSTMLPPTTVAEQVSPEIWPRQGSDVRYVDPVSAAEGFAVDFVGFDPVIVGDFAPGDSRSGEVEVRTRPEGTPTVVHVRRLADDAWVVVGASNENITVAQPAVLDEIASPMVVAGSAMAFEGTVQVMLYSDGSDEPIVTGFVTGSGGPEPGPFAEVFEWNTVTARGGTLLLFSTSPADGSIEDATALRLRFHDVPV